MSLLSGYHYSTSCFVACTLCIIFSLIVLSLQPHQEPRFLTPLVVPFVVLVTNSGYIETVNRVFLVRIASIARIRYSYIHCTGNVDYRQRRPNAPVRCPTPGRCRTFSASPERSNFLPTILTQLHHSVLEDIYAPMAFTRYR